MLLENACCEPDDVGVYRDLHGGAAGGVVLPVGAAPEHVGQGLVPGGGDEVPQAAPLAGDPGAVTQGLVDGGDGGADGGFDSRRNVPSASTNSTSTSAAAPASSRPTAKPASATRHLTIDPDHPVPQLNGSARANALGALAMPQLLWHRTPVLLTSSAKPSAF